MSQESVRVTQTPEGLLFTVHVQPRASRSEICGPKEGELRVRLTSPPVDDAANKQCVELIAKSLGIAKSKVSIKSGAKSRHKVVRVEGVEQDDLDPLFKIDKEHP
ncbi:DUF167 domain-containing protein [Geomonas paludis]|uniref:UPF0235 protein GMPD_18740 n=1 Tax=Geomonas paludis TaxID=2740185 RepID=A0A6V8MUT7_9BACT|nr:DUF167 domain-containing protein [Geomonas paludis]UPU37515.1 DUF167 domain-containing protein [Geomonas paludis]GFO63955.1 UPF0235 protein [Geomonas paludis]